MAQEGVGYVNPNSSGPQGGSRLRRIGKSICNTEKGEFLGRTCSSWVKIGIFYTVFYACLAGFFALMLIGFFATLDERAPTQQRMYSLIKGNPGMGFRPMPNVESTLIKFSKEDNNTYQPYINNLNNFLKVYKAQNFSLEDCPKDFQKDLTICQVNMSMFGPCTEDNNYGYDEGLPCVLLKINRVYDWLPKPFSANETGLTGDEKNRFEQFISPIRKNIPLSSNHITVSCEGENEADEDNIINVEFYPPSGFPYRFYPYMNQPGYLSPIVFARFNVTQGALVQVWCKLWAKNIKHHKNDKAGSTHFELFVDK
ncbi:hypothetical protein HELRODRAFT_76092 [Helobdella robusta]|uniref:Sodium/potassium-transporting ATPase subunit beta n=1 Tax=Helobdella robusta TaxID=6412 RepID=T1G2E8_HELRO|nr:hypothetical protein HELRODRAFT_76092 [Helobdella robusta]ESO07774.1 hypothetical protein HELRODRAFT_76092 [Helobdella robusta]